MHEPGLPQSRARVKRVPGASSKGLCPVGEAGHLPLRAPYAQPSNVSTTSHLWCPAHLPRSGCGLWGGASEACGRAWHLLSQPGRAGRRALSLQHTARLAEGSLGGKPEVTSSDSAACLPPEELPWRTGHLHVALASVPANLHTTRHSRGIVFPQERGTCNPDNELGGSCLAWASASLGQQCPLLCSCPPRVRPSLGRSVARPGSQLHCQPGRWFWHTPWP